MYADAKALGRPLTGDAQGQYFDHLLKRGQLVAAHDAALEMPAELPHLFGLERAERVCRYLAAARRGLVCLTGVVMCR